MKVCRGFTLLELMVTIAVLAIITTIGVPSFRELVQNNRVTSQTNELVAAITFARTEAIKRGRAVTAVVAVANPGWSVTVTAPDADGNPATLRQVDRQGSQVAINTGLTVVFGPTGVPAFFNPLGVPVAGGEIHMQPGSCTGQKRRRIEVGRSGQITTTRQACT